MVSIPWKTLGSNILHFERELSDREFMSYFKMPVSLVQYLWKTLQSSFHCRPRYLLWTLHYLKSRNPSELEISRILGTTVKTMKIRVTITLRQIFHLLPNVCYENFQLND
jgi:hypothetical protein